MDYSVCETFLSWHLKINGHKLLNILSLWDIVQTYIPVYYYGKKITSKEEEIFILEYGVNLS